MTERVPFVDLRAQLPVIEAEVRAGWDRIVASASFVLGAEVEAFESELAAFFEAPHAVAVGNGTDALELAYRAAGVGPGDEVLVPANTFIATALAVVRAGARPVFVDVDPQSLLMDPAASRAAIGPRTRAMAPVHLYGQAAPMTALLEIAREHDLRVVEDAAQAHGARHAGRAVGTLGELAATSFYPGKNLGAFGDGGAVLTNSAEHAARLRALRNYGSETKYHHPIVGFNSRLDALQAVVLRAKLPRLAAWNEARRVAATRYDEALADLEPVRRVETAEGNEHVHHLYVVRVANRDAVLGALHAAGVDAGVHYPVPCHLHGAFDALGHRAGDFPIAERAAEEILSLPIFPEITEAQQARVVDALRAAVTRSTSGSARNARP